MNEIKLSKDYLLQVTNELYRITLLFPKKEPLRYKMRKIGNEILANFVDLSGVSSSNKKIKLSEESGHKIEILDGFLDIARAQNWVRASDLLSLQKEYNVIKDKLLEVSNDSDKKTVQETAHVPVYNRPKKEKKERVEKRRKAPERVTLSNRQEKILTILEKEEQAQVNDMIGYFPEISKRTLRRDLKDLLENSLIIRKGRRNNTFYEVRES